MVRNLQKHDRNKTELSHNLPVNLRQHDVYGMLRRMVLETDENLIRKIFRSLL